MIFELLVGLAAFAAGAIATVTGFGIGSILTPLFAVRTGTQLAVAAVSIPHFFATLLRFWRLRAHVDRRVLLKFGIASAAGGLIGAILHNSAANRILGIVFGALLIFVAVSELTGLARRMQFSGPVAWVAGALSGFLGGLVGNQGGIRSAALLGFDIDKRAFVATATAVGVIVDVARMPAYFATQWRELVDVLPLITIATVAAILGTFLGERLLRGIPENLFRRVVAVLVLVLGAYMLSRFIPAQHPVSFETRLADSTAVAGAPGAP
jgi:hypothetical protein